MKEDMMIQKTHTVLVGLFVNNGKNEEEEFERSLAEMKTLAATLGFGVVCTMTQTLPSPAAGTYFGSGKIEELKNLLDERQIDTVLVEGVLSPVQMKNLSDMLDAEVMDRTAVILEIFSEHAKTRESRMQVESAQLEYMLPRLAGMRSQLGRQGGASGAMSNKGAGEKKIELDRRVIEHRMAELRRELEVIDRERATQRKKRMLSQIPRVALVGYTNAGKSTIMNAMLALYGTDDEKQVLEKDMLFATLDTAVRNIAPDTGRPFLLTDTVGFISGLPATLVKAFRSTLEEVKYADLILHVIDISDPSYREQMKVTEKTLSDIGAGDIRQLYIYNKCDNAGFSTEVSIEARQKSIRISARSEKDIQRLTDLIEETLNEGRIECDMLIPYSDGAALSALRDSSDYEVTGYDENGTKIHARCTAQDAGKYGKYMISV